MDYKEILASARAEGGLCKACPECNGKACGNMIPGPGAKGYGDTAMLNYNAWKSIRVNMDNIFDSSNIDTSCELFGHKFAFPFFAGPVGAIKNHYGEKYDDMQYNEILVPTCYEEGILAFTGDGINPEVVKSAKDSIKKVGGVAIPTIKPWGIDIIKEKFAIAKEAGAIAIAMDIDAGGLPFMRGVVPPAGPKTVEQLREINEAAGVPFIVKGIMTVKGALKAKEAGAAAIVVSNHGGRVLDQCPPTAEVLPEIAAAVGKDMIILVDGGIRSGVDVFKAIACGAHAAMITRPFVTMAYGAGAEGIRTYIKKIGTEFYDTMEMCGARTVAEITPDMVRLP